MENQTNDLENFIYNVTKEIASEYERIQKRSKEDPGTAGDQGEENWAEIIRNWLPKDYQVVIKGRLMNSMGLTSSQVDIIVLKPFYPKYLLNKKLYLTSGVIAVFECKNTLKAEHIETFVKNSVKIRNLLPIDYGEHIGHYKTEMNSPIIYGLLAHSHIWKSDNSTPEENIENRLWEEDHKNIKHPRECVDLICVSDLATWFSHKAPLRIDGPKTIEEQIRLGPKPQWGKIPNAGYGITNSKTITFVEQRYNRLIPIAGMLTELYSKLAIYDKRLKHMSHYFNRAIGSSSHIKKSRDYSYDIFSDEAKLDLEINKLEYQKRWYR